MRNLLSVVDFLLCRQTYIQFHIFSFACSFLCAQYKPGLGSVEEVWRFGSFSTFHNPLSVWEYSLLRSNDTSKWKYDLNKFDLVTNKDGLS